MILTAILFFIHPFFLFIQRNGCFSLLIFHWFSHSVGQVSYIVLNFRSIFPQWVIHTSIKFLGILSVNLQLKVQSSLKLQNVRILHESLKWTSKYDDILYISLWLITKYSIDPSYYNNRKHNCLRYSKKRLPLLLPSNVISSLTTFIEIRFHTVFFLFLSFLFDGFGTPRNVHPYPPRIQFLVSTFIEISYQVSSSFVLFLSSSFHQMTHQSITKQHYSTQKEQQLNWLNILLECVLRSQLFKRANLQLSVCHCLRSQVLVLGKISKHFAQCDISWHFQKSSQYFGQISDFTHPYVSGKELEKWQKTQIK